jgi:Fe-S oxidoreductase
MTSTDTQFPLELNQPRLSIQKPEPRYDKQGEMADTERLDRAMRGFVKDFGATAALYMESCVHCGQCAEVCQYYVQTGDPRYTPIWKLEPFKQAYKREAGPFAPFFRLFNLKRRVTVQELEDWQDLIYDSCTQCGRCTMVCPMGIDIASLVGLARHGMAAAGLVPHELWATVERAKREGSPLGATPAVLKDRIAWLEDEHGVEIPLDRERADVLMTISSIEVMKYPQSIVALARIMKRMGASWTFRSDGYEATNFSMFAGDQQGQREASLKLIEAAIAVGASMLILPECGHAYQALRWQGANLYGKPLPFRVLQIAEYLAEGIRQGKLQLQPVQNSATFHDPCQIVRRGGATEAPREVLRALGVDLREMDAHGAYNWCCGGGGGVVTIHRADPLRYKTYQIKMQQVEDTGAEMLVSTCSNCRQTFDDGQAHFHGDRKAQSLLELVADHLVTEQE